MIKTTLLVIAAAIALIAVYAAFKPTTFLIERSTVIAAPPARVFGLINDLKAFNRWNPFAKQDPSLKLQYEAITEGSGAAYRWDGPKAGIGRMQISASVPSQQIMLDLDFSKPMQAHNKVVFSLVPQGTGTQVSWAMSGAMPYAHRLMTVFFSMDKMVGTQFEAGLVDLKALAETPE